MPVRPTRMDRDGRRLVDYEQLVILKHSVDLQEEEKEEVTTPQG